MCNRKVRVVLLLILICMLIYATNGFAASKKIKVVIDSKEIPSDVSPMIISGRVMVPLRMVSNAMGAKLDWNQFTETIIISKNSDVIILKVRNKEATINGKKVNDWMV